MDQETDASEARTAGVDEQAVNEPAKIKAEDTTSPAETTDETAQRLNVVLEELNLSQYYTSFVDHGFDTWDTILDITESDLRIANFRGVAPDVALSAQAQSWDDAALSQELKREHNTAMRHAAAGGLAKRRYRRHPKADESAPERPPSAYVLFSNKIREELRGRAMTFTEIAKHVGESWQGLTATQREPYETQAQLAKEKYNSDLATYKKTDAYKKYLVYLQEFRAKHSAPTQDKDALKRIKLCESQPTSTEPLDTCSASSPTHSDHHDDSEHDRHERQHNKRARDPTDDHSSRSGSESPHGDAAHHSRKRRCGSVGSASDISVPPTPTMVDHPHGGVLLLPTKDLPASPQPLSSRPDSPTQHETTAPLPARNNSNNGGAHKTVPAQLNLPSLSHMFDADYPQRSPAPVSGADTLAVANNNGTASPSRLPHSLSMSNSNASNTSLASAASSYFAASNGSSASSSGSGSHPRTPLEGSMPIHALLSGETAKLVSSPASPPLSSVSPRSAPAHNHSQSQMPSYVSSYPQSYSQSYSQSYPQSQSQLHQQHLAQQYHHPSQPSPPHQYQQSCQQPCPLYAHQHVHHGPAHIYQHAVSPRHSPPPTAWSYGHTSDLMERHPSMHGDYGMGSMARHVAPTSYQFRS
ncbi:hypothetical protein SEPCBS119000_002257 [Sporothrix epigloea]|uniref:HMG box domain-containing protein n=1 Tax=Sporothrix epigloea TaxID=1892477 RepID=A0ABP0DF76_9PEZI